MAIKTVSNRFKYRLLNAISGHTIKAILMQSGFSFNKDTHHVYSDISASELSTANGYTAGGTTLANITVTEDDNTDSAVFSADDVTWTASGAGLTARAGVLYDTSDSNTIIGCIDFESDSTVPAGAMMKLENIRVSIT